MKEQNLPNVQGMLNSCELLKDSTLSIFVIEDLFQDVVIIQCVDYVSVYGQDGVLRRIILFRGLQVSRDMGRIFPLC